MPIRSLHSCARQYAQTWSQGELPIYEGLASGDRHRRLEAIQKGAGYFRIARNFHRTYDTERGLPRLEPVLGVLEPYRAIDMDRTTMCATVATLRVALGARYGGGDKLSAATKFLWILRRAPAIIYDSQARFALGAPAGDYDRYVDLWLRGYRENRTEIAEACAAISMKAATAVPFSRGAAPEWFRQRVYDIYLWRAGSEKKRVRAV